MCKSTVDTSTLECKCNEGVNPAAFAGYGRWQPIETVPKDGTWIMLGYYPEYMEGKQQGGHPVIAWWNDTQKLWCDGASFLNAEGAFSPTHWMPLPEGP